MKTQIEKTSKADTLLKCSVILFVLALIVCFSNNAKGQSFDSITPYQNEVIKMVDQTVERNYTTFPAFGHVEPTLFERSFCPHRYLKTRNERVMLDMAFQITIRMLNLRSSPIRTPDYSPSATLYALLNKNLDNSTLFGFLTLAHHSNGQDASFYNEDGSVNLKDGNFSTNFIKAGLTKSVTFFNGKTKSFYSCSFEQHLNIDRNVELNGTYGFSRLHFDFKSREVSINTSKTTDKRTHYLRFSINNTFITDQITKTKLGDLSKRLICSAKLYYRNAALKNFSVFIQAYQGQDYYNIQFVNNISFIRAGICCEPASILASRKSKTNSKNNI